MFALFDNSLLVNLNLIQGIFLWLLYFPLSSKLSRTIIFWTEGDINCIPSSFLFSLALVCYLG